MGKNHLHCENVNPIKWKTLHLNFRLEFLSKIKVVPKLQPVVKSTLHFEFN